MKKFLSILLAVMMVLSTVSFAAPSLAGTADTAAEVPVAEAPAEESADLAADVTDEFGTLIAEVNFNETTLGNFDAGSGVRFSALGAKIYNTDLANATFHLGSGETYVAQTAVVKERAIGDNYLELTTNAAGSYNLIQLYTGASSIYYATEEGYLTVVFDAYYGDSAANGHYFDIAYNRSQQAEAKDTTIIHDLKENGGWGRVISSFDDEIGMTGIGGNSATMVPEAVNYLKIHGASGVKVGETFGIDNIRVYWRPRTADVTIDVDGGEDILLENQSTLGVDLDALAAQLPAVEGKKLVGFSLTKGGDTMRTLKFPGDCTIYPVYEERVALNGSLEFNDAADFTKFVKRQGSNNALAADFVTHDATNGYLKATFDASNDIMVQDTGLNNIPVNFPAGVLTNIEFKVRFTGMPQESGKIGGQNYNPAAVGWPELYYTTGGTFILGDDFTCDLTGKNGEWITFNYSVEELGITDLTTFRFDFYNYMPDGSTMEIDYIRFIGKPVRVTVDNGANATAPVVKMDLTTTTTVAEVAAKFAKDHGDMKFVGLSRTPGGAVLAGSELVSATGAPTTLYAVWDNYEYLTKYSVDFDADDEGWYSVKQQCNDGNTYWVNDGVLTLKSTAPAGFNASRDHYLFINTVEGNNKLPAGVVTEIAVRMRYRNIAGKTGDYTTNRNGGTTEKFNPNNAQAYVHIWDYNGTIKSNDRRESNLVDGEWFTRYFDAETYFPNGISQFRIDTAFPLPDGVEVDYDYVRFIGDNENVNIPGAEFIGKYGEKVFDVDFNDATTGELATRVNTSTVGADINSWLCSASKLELSYGTYPSTNAAPTVNIKEKSSTDKYVEYTLNSAGSVSNMQLSVPDQFVKKDGYFIFTFDFKSDVEKPFTFRFNKHNLVEDTAENIEVIENGEWDTAIVYYDEQIGSSRPSNGNVVGGIDEINIVKWHPVAGAPIGQTICIDNLALWFVPKTTEVTVDLTAYEKGNIVIKDYPTIGMTRDELTRALPAVADREVVGLSYEDGGEAIYMNKIAAPATVYPVYEKVKILDQTLEFNSTDDFARISAISGGFRLGKNNAKTLVGKQFVITSDDTASYISMENEAATGEEGAVIDYGFMVTNTPFSKKDVKEIVIRLRLKNIPATAKKYTCGTHCSAGGHTFTPTDADYMELVWWDADSSAVKQQYVRGNLVSMGDDWFTYSIPAANFPYENILKFRFDPFGDVAPNGTAVEVDYIRFYGYPEPDAVPLKWSADFNTNANGVSLNSWKKEDGTYMFDDGVNGDKGPGIGSKYLTEGAEGYITWNADGYVTLNFDANNEIIGDASDRGYTPAVYDPSIYVASLDKNSYIPAGSFDELKIRMRLRGLPADGTEIYGQDYSGLKSATFSMNTYPVYFHWMNSTDAVKYDGVQSKKFDDTCKFTEGSYVRDEWFEVTIPASFFEADVEDLATLRINLPDWTPDGTKIDIDYIKFMGAAPEASAPETISTVDFRPATADKTNAIRFKASITSDTSDAASDIGWLVTTADYLDTIDVLYTDFDATVAATAGKKVVTGFNRQSGVDNTRWFDDSLDTELVFAGALTKVPAKNALDTLVIRPVVKAADEYFYGDVIQTSLYEVAIEPYLNWISKVYENMAELADSGEWTFDDCIDFDFEYNDDYYELPEDQQTYIEETLIGLLG